MESISSKNGLRLLDISLRRELQLVRQSENSECGLACAAMIASYHGFKVDLLSLRRNHAFSSRGATLASIISVLDSLKISSRPVRCEITDLKDMHSPVILHWQLKHFVVLDSFANDHAIILDPALGRMVINAKELSKSFTGVALICEPRENFEKQELIPKRTILELVGARNAYFSPVAQAIVLSLIIEIFGLCMPLYMQNVIDQIVPKSDINLLDVIFWAFLTVALFDAGVRLMRGIVLQFISSQLALQFKTRVFSHMLRLPLEWFHKRTVGDIQSKFNSIGPIQSFLSDGVIESVLDAAFSVILFTLMFLYSSKLAIICLGSLIIYIVIKILLQKTRGLVESNKIILEAESQSHFLETCRSIHTIKAGAQEDLRDTQQRNHFNSSVNASVKVGNVELISKFFSGLVVSVTSLLVVYLGTKDVLESSLTIGMLMAFIAYNLQFSSRIVRLIEQIFLFKLLSVQTERLSDIIDTDLELVTETSASEISGALSCTDLTFSYSKTERPVLEKFNLEIRAGEYVAIIGASGCGKSTLLKLITGVYRPTSGKIMLDSVDVSQGIPKSIRKQIAVITQDDQLLSGTIAQNISSFESEVDDSDIYTAAYLANIHDEILAMPMGYSTLVGDLGSSFSGGQKQRLIIARALYKKPKLLILDEATSHLDADNEMSINLQIKGMNFTRIVVAHRRETIESADRIINLENLKLVS